MSEMNRHQGDGSPISFFIKGDHNHATKMEEEKFRPEILANSS
jgi:hypothetical protein